MITLEQLESLNDREFRHLYVSDSIREMLAAQIRDMREERGWSQAELGEKVGMAQPRVSLLEDPDYSGLNLKTLKRLGKAFDVALLVEWVSFRERLERIQERVETHIPSYAEDLADARRISTWQAFGSATASTTGVATAEASMTDVLTATRRPAQQTLVEPAETSEVIMGESSYALAA